MNSKVSFNNATRYLDLTHLGLVFRKCPRWLRPSAGRMGQEREWALARGQKLWAQFRASAGLRGIPREVSKGHLDCGYHRVMGSHRAMLIDTGPGTFLCCIEHSPTCTCHMGRASRLPLAPEGSPVVGAPSWWVEVKMPSQGSWRLCSQASLFTRWE